MIIKCVSIEGSIANPLENEELMEKEIKLAIKQQVDLLVFPSNSLRSESIKDLDNNLYYMDQLCQAEDKLEEYIDSLKDIKVIYKDSQIIEDEELINVHTGYNHLDFLTDSYSITELELMSRKNNSLDILCLGRGTESVCQGVYSNLKAIAYKGEIISITRNEENAIILNFDPADYIGKTPYLKDQALGYMFYQILEKQSYALVKKMERMNRKKIVMGISGGLDSAVSFLVCVEAFKKYNLPLENIICITMPGFGTTERTYKNALTLMDAFSVTKYDIDLKPLLTMHLNNLQQPEGVYDLTYEQTQSRERTQVLLDFANKENAIMIGTGCMSEFALGWMTYGGDHLSMFAINIGLPKTVVKQYANWFIEKYYPSNLSDIIKDVLNGPVSPELLPINDKGEQHEKTEELVGKYELQDFFIYNIIKNNYSIKKIFDLACKVFDELSKEYIFNKLEIFVTRFFTRQYKKNCYGDGVQIFDFSVSPLTGFAVASDVDNTIFKQQLDEIKKGLKK